MARMVVRTDLNRTTLCPGTLKMTLRKSPAFYRLKVCSQTNWPSEIIQKCMRFTKLLSQQSLIFLLTIAATSAPRSHALDNCPDKTPSNCVVTTQQLGSWFESTDRTVVDIRDENAFNKVRIPKSLNYPPFSLKRNRYLKGRPLLIMGYPWSARDLAAICSELKDAGFSSVLALKGGILSWKLTGLDLEGDSSSLEVPQTISAQQLLQQYAPEDLLFLSGEPILPPIQNAFPNSVRQFNFGVGYSTLPKKLEAFLISAIGNDDKVVALMAKDPRVLASAMEGVRQLPDKKRFMIFLVEGGQDSIVKFLDEHQAYLNAIKDAQSVKSCR